MIRRRDRREEAIMLHRRAVAELLTAARELDDAAWPRPVAPGKWSPAEIVTHLRMADEAVIRELSGGPSLRLRTPLWMRLPLRLTLKPRLLAGKRFPKGVRAPREARPEGPTAPRAETIERFGSGAARLREALSDVHGRRHRVRLTHPYFGAMSAEETLRFTARHIEHHTRQLRPEPKAAV